MTLNITPPAEELTLDPIEEVQDVTVGQVQDATHGSFVDPKAVNPQAERAAATELAQRVSSVPTKSVEFKHVMDAVENYGDDAIRKSAEASNRILERASTSVHGANKKGNSTQVEVANTLGELRTIVGELTPADKDFKTKIMGFLPGGGRLKRYFQRYESAQGQLDAVLTGLADGEDSLLRDNAALRVEQQNSWNAMQELAKASRVMEQMDKDISDQVEKLKYEGRTEEAKNIEADVLFPVRQRRQDLATQTAVSVQSYLSLGLVEKNNKELIKGVKRAKTTTMTALRSAVILAEAMAGQKLVLDKIDAINNTTNSLISKNAETLQQQTTRIHQQAASSGVDPAVLEKSFAAIESTMDAIDNYKVQANAAMERTTERLEAQINQTKPFLERARQSQLQSGSEQDQAASGLTR